MISVVQLRGKLAKAYQRKVASWAVAPSGRDEPIVVGLQPPSDRRAAADLASVAQWLKEWSEIDIPGVVIEWETRRWPNSGTQQIPVRLHAASVEALARFTGQYRHWQLYRGRALRLLELAPGDQSVAFATAVSKVLAKVATLSDEDFALVFDVLTWLGEHPDSGFYPRQLPVPGIHSKWIERHSSVIRPLHMLLGGSENMGLVSPTRLYRVRFLDSSFAPGGLTDLMAAVDQLSKLDLQPRVVLIIENLQTLLSLPPFPRTVAIHGAGYDVAWCSKLPWIHKSKILYWGDLDADGLQILAKLRSVRPDAQSFLMDAETLQTFEQFSVPDPNGKRETVPTGLHRHETETFELLRDRGGVRLEQERIPWAAAVAELSARIVAR